MEFNHTIIMLRVLRLFRFIIRSNALYKYYGKQNSLLVITYHNMRVSAVIPRSIEIRLHSPYTRTPLIFLNN